MSRLLQPLRRLPTLRQTTTAPSTRITTTPVRRASNFLQNHPSPPRLPADQQAEFERLQRAAEAALSSHNAVPSSASDLPSSSSSSSSSTSSVQHPLTTSRHVSSPSSNPAQQQQQQQAHARASATVPQDPGAGTFSGGIRQGAPPEFEGDRNPRTGEVGGPKNEPLRWGSAGDWSYNGRVTDF